VPGFQRDSRRLTREVVPLRALAPDRRQVRVAHKAEPRLERAERGNAILTVDQVLPFGGIDRRGVDERRVLHRGDERERVHHFSVVTGELTRRPLHRHSRKGIEPPVVEEPRDSVVVVSCHARGCDPRDLVETSDWIGPIPDHIAKAEDRANPLTLKTGEDRGQGFPV